MSRDCYVLGSIQLKYHMYTRRYLDRKVTELEVVISEKGTVIQVGGHKEFLDYRDSGSCFLVFREEKLTPD